MNILLRLLLAVLVKLIFISFAHAYTITSSSDEEDTNFSVYSISYSRENVTLPPSLSAQARPHIGDFLTKGAYMSIKYTGMKKRTLTFEIRGIKERNQKLYILMPNGNVTESVSSESYSLSFNNKDNRRTKRISTVYFLLESRLKADIQIIVREKNIQKEIPLSFKSSRPTDYCKLTVIDAKGEISFKNRISSNNAGFIYDTDHEKNLSFKYRINVKDGSVNNKAKKLLNENFNTVFIENVPYEPGKNRIFRDVNGLINLTNRINKGNKYKVNGTGLIRLNPLVNIEKNKLPAGTYNIRTTVTCD